MLTGDQDLPNGIGMARLAWSRLPTADGAAPLPEGPAASTSAAAQDELFVGAVESLDYEVIENYAYREEQAQWSKFWVPYYIMLKWFFALLIGVGTMGASSSSSSLATARLPPCILPPVPGASGPLIVVAGEVRSQVRSREAYQQRVAYYVL